MRAFLHRHLDPADRLGEVLFGLIMALGFTGAVRLGLEEPDNRALLVAIFGCNLAWAVVDSVMYVLGSLFERGRKARLAREVASAATDEAAMQQVGSELDGPLMELTTPAERAQIYRSVIAVLRRSTLPPARLRIEDLLGGAAVALVIIVSTLPILVPFVAVSDAAVAVRIANLIGLAMLFLLGMWWGRVVGSSPLRLAAGLTLVGAVLVLVTILLGG
jgi:VIT1/CCC1 family predicted Fe2+/Mn2+ transporter